MQFRRGDQPVSATPTFPLSVASLPGLQFLLRRCEPDLPDLAEIHMLLGMPEIMIILHGKPTLRRTERERSRLERFVRRLFAGLLFQPPATAPRSCPLTSRPHNPIRQNTRH